MEDYEEGKEGQCKTREASNEHSESVNGAARVNDAMHMRILTTLKEEATPPPIVVFTDSVPEICH